MTNVELEFFASGAQFFSKKKKTDWEERRFKIAKDVFAGLVQVYPDNIDKAVEDAVYASNKLIEALKKNKQ